MPVNLAPKLDNWHVKHPKTQSAKTQNGMSSMNAAAKWDKIQKTKAAELQSEQTFYIYIN